MNSQTAVQTSPYDSSSRVSDPLWHEYENWQVLFLAQTGAVQSFLSAQADLLAASLVDRCAEVQFQLPDCVVIEPSHNGTAAVTRSIPQGQRQQIIRRASADLFARVRSRLSELEGSGDQAAAVSAGLLRFETAGVLIRALPQSGNAASPGAGKAVDAREAEAYIASLHRLLATLDMATGMMPCIAADEAYRRKREGILAQLTGQGQALARCQVQEIVGRIQRRAEQGDLNRGLSLSLPYFDDQELAIRLRSFQVTPPGRVMFAPVFVAHAAVREQASIAQDMRLAPSTRDHLLQQLELLARAFFTSLQK